MIIVARVIPAASTHHPSERRQPSTKPLLLLSQTISSSSAIALSAHDCLPGRPPLPAARSERHSNCARIESPAQPAVTPTPFQPRRTTKVSVRETKRISTSRSLSAQPRHLCVTQAISNPGRNALRTRAHVTERGADGLKVAPCGLDGQQAAHPASAAGINISSKSTGWDAGRQLGRLRRTAPHRTVRCP